MSWSRADSIQSAVKDCHAVIILTEWEEFKNISWTNLIKKMKRPAWIFDTRSVVNVLKAEEAGFNIWQIGNYSSQKIVMYKFKLIKKNKKKLYLFFMDL